MLLGKLFDELRIRIALIIRAISHFLLHFVELGLHLRVVGESLAGLLLDGSIVLEFHHLRQVTDGRVIRHSHHARRRLLQATENLQHGRLARTILTDEGNTVSVIDHETHIVEQRLHTEFHL